MATTDADTTSTFSNDNVNNVNTESLTLRSLLGDENNEQVRRWFESAWQEQAVEFRWQNRKQFLPNNATTTSSSSSSTAGNHWNDEAVQASPYEAMVQQGFHVLTHLLTEASHSSDNDAHTSPLIFKDQCGVTDELESTYHGNLFAAFLDGCSVVLNHADWTSPWVAALCQDLQRSFPHAYANVYITPPASQAVRAHADDRDVIVIQVAGKKQWTVYSKIPIPFPYPHEQVGKEALPVPQEVLHGPKLIQTTLYPGDALYMPRGYVHEAKATHDDFSFHVTIALATHDWTLAGIITNATEKILTTVLDYRKAIPRRLGIHNLQDIPPNQKILLQTQIQQAFQLLQNEITLQTISDNLTHKFHRHNHRAYSARMKLIHQMRFPTPPVDSTTTAAAATTTTTTTTTVLVGPLAARTITLETRIRAATEHEKQSVPIHRSTPRGLLVREAVAEKIVQILTALKQNTRTTEGIPIRDLKSVFLFQDNDDPLVCPLTLLSFAKVCIEQGALAVVP